MATQHHGYNASGEPVKRDYRRNETLVPSRRLMHLVNNDDTFLDGQRHLGLFPQKLYKLVQEAGIERTKRVIDFILSIALETPSFFYVDRQGNYDPSPEGIRTRARNMAIAMIMDPKKKILTKYAGQRYFDRWGKEQK